MHGAIVGNSATGRKKFTDRKWVALIGFYSVETWNQVQKNGKRIEKARGAMEVRIILVIAIKEQQVDVDRQSSRVWFGNNIAEDI